MLVFYDFSASYYSKTNTPSSNFRQMHDINEHFKINELEKENNVLRLIIDNLEKTSTESTIGLKNKI